MCFCSQHHGSGTESELSESLRKKEARRQKREREGRRQGWCPKDPGVRVLLKGCFYYSGLFRFPHSCVFGRWGRVQSEGCTSSVVLTWNPRTLGSS